MSRFSKIFLTLLCVTGSGSAAAQAVQIEGMSPAPAGQSTVQSEQQYQSQPQTQPQTLTQPQAQPQSSQAVDTKTFIKNLTSSTGCSPYGDNKCEVTAKNVGDLFQYMLNCSALSGWIVHYAQSKTLNVTINGGGDSCQMVFTDTHFPDSPKSVTCNFTKEQITQMYQDLSSGDALSKYEQSGQQVNDDILRKAKPIVDCVKPISQINVEVQNPNPSIPAVQPAGQGNSVPAQSPSGSATNVDTDTSGSNDSDINPVQ